MKIIKKRFHVLNVSNINGLFKGNLAPRPVTSYQKSITGPMRAQSKWHRQSINLN